MRKTYQNSDYQQHLAEQSGQQGETFSLHPEHLEMPREQASREVSFFLTQFQKNFNLILET